MTETDTTCGTCGAPIVIVKIPIRTWQPRSEPLTQARCSVDPDHDVRGDRR